MFAAMLFTISIVALAQFGLYYWRAVLSGVAAQPVSDRVLWAAHVENGRVTSQHFETLAGLHDLTPDLYPNRGGLGLVRLASTRGAGLPRPVDGRVGGVPFSEHLPVLGVPRVVERLHPLQIFVAAQGLTSFSHTVDTRASIHPVISAMTFSLPMSWSRSW